MSTAITIICVIVAAVSSLGWLVEWGSNAVLLWYLSKKDIPFPSDKETAEGTKWVLSHIVNDLKFWKRKKGDNK